MKISRIEIADFRSHAHTVLEDLSAVTFIVGQNRSGKSSIIDALSYAMRGVCRGTDEAGRGSEGLTRRGVKTGFNIALATDAGPILRRGPGQGPRSDAQRAIDLVLGAGARAVDPLLLIDGDAFLRLPVTEQKAALQKALVTRIDPKDVAERLGPAFVRLAPLRLDWSLPATLDVAEKYVRERRKVLKGILSSIAPADLTPYPPQMRTLTAVQAGQEVLGVEEKLKALRAEHRRIAVDLTGLQQIAQAAAERVTRLNVVRDQAQAKVPPEGKPVDVDAWNARVTKNATNLEAVRLVAAPLAELEKEMDALKAGSAAACPACQRPYDEATVTARMTAVLDRVAKAREAAEAIPALQEAHRDTLAECQAAFATVQKRAALVEAATLAANEAASAMLEAKQAQENLNAAKKAAGTPEQVAAVEKRIENGEAILGQLRAYQQVRVAMDRQVKTIQDTQAELADTETLVERLGPHGIRQGLAGSNDHDFVATVTEVARTLRLDVALTMEPYTLLVNGGAPAALSRSESMCVGLALQVALARLAGLNFICVDNAEVFDTETRALVSQIVGGGLVEQVIMCATLKMPDADFKGLVLPEGWRAFHCRLVDGASMVVAV